MKWRYLLSVALFTFLVHSCRKEDQPAPVVYDPSVNQSPIANAGLDKTIVLPTNSVTLDGRASTDPDNNITTYSWRKIAGPTPANIFDLAMPQTPVTNLTEGVYAFALKVTDAGGLFSEDTVLITVKQQQKSHWTLINYLPGDEFFLGSFYSWWFNGFNFLMGIGDEVFAISNKGNFWKYSGGWGKVGIFPMHIVDIPIFFSVNNKGYSIGNGTCWQYDPLNNQWTRKKDPPGNIEAPLVINNKVYFRNSKNQLIAYDPSTDSYDQKNNHPYVGHRLLGSFVINGQGYYIGENRTCWKYDPASNDWQQKAGFNVAGLVVNTSSFSLNNYGYIIGDLDQNAYNSNSRMKLWRYDPEINQWIQFEEDYPGDGAYEISTVSLTGVVYVGLGFNKGDFNATDFWSFK